MPGQCITYSRRQSALASCGEEVPGTDREAEHCTSKRDRQKELFLVLYIAVRQPSPLALHSLNGRMSKFLRTSEAAPAPHCITQLLEAK